MSTALLVIDAQKAYTDAASELYCPDSAETVQRINALIARFTDRKEPIVFVRHVNRVDGRDLGRMYDYAGDASGEFDFKDGTSDVEYADGLVRPADAIEITKTRYSAFLGTDLEKILREKQIDRVVICGFMTNFCCESTARDAHDRDFFVDFILDATGTPGTEHMDEARVREVVGELLAAGFAHVLLTGECLVILTQ